MKNQRAFTLIELLLSLAIAAMLAVALHAAMSTAYRAKQTAENAVEPLRAGSVAMELICRDLAAAPGPPSSTDGKTYLGGPFTGIHQASGTGDNDDLEFRTLAREEGKDDDPLGDGLKIVEYLVQPGQTPTLVRRVTRNILADNIQSADEVICKNVRGLSFKFYDGSDWQTDWDSTIVGDVLPMAVMVTIQLSDPTVTGGPTPGAREISRVVPMPCAKQIVTTVGTSGL